MDLWDEMFNRMHHDFFGDWRTALPTKKMTKYKPATTDLKVTDKEIIASLEIPGVDKKDIELDITENRLKVRAEKKSEIKKEEKTYYRHESSYSGFYREMMLPVKVVAGKARASYKNGVLKVTIPRAEPRKKEKSTKVKVE